MRLVSRFVHHNDGRLGIDRRSETKRCMGPLVFGRIRSHKMGKKLNCKSEWVSKRSESVELRLEGREANFGKERIG